MDWLLNPIAAVLGYIFKYIDVVVNALGGGHNTGICIIIFTFVVNGLMFPLTFKQQKTAKIQAIVQPEIQAIQNKYKGKKDNESMQRMQSETQAVYDKYGISMFGGCLPLLITMPILFALYRVIYGIAAQNPSLADNARFSGYKDYVGVPELAQHLTFLGLPLFENVSAQFSAGNYFALIIPIIAIITQFASTKLSTAGNNKNKKKDASSGGMGDSMKMMNLMMPFVSGIFCFTLPICVGIYWISGNLFRIVQAIIVNQHFKKMNLDEIVEENAGKAAAKASKRQVRNEAVANYSKQKTASIKTNAKGDTTSTPKDLNVNKNVKPGSIAGYANMLSGGKSDNKKGDE